MRSIDAGTSVRPATNWKLSWGASFTTAGAIIIGLRDEGWVDDSGDYRLTRRGHRAVVWVARHERNPNPVFTRRGKGKWEMACRATYDALLLGDLSGAMDTLSAVIAQRG
jgi:hypothetical protein